MSTLHSSLRIRLGRNLELKLDRWAADPLRSYMAASWSATLNRAIRRRSSGQLVFAYGGERTPRVSADHSGTSVWVGSANFPIPADQRERVECWIAENEDTNTPEGADRVVSTGASHAGRFLRLREVRALVGLSTATIYRKVHAGDFPRQIQLGASSVRWAENQVRKWMDERMQQTSTEASP